jgi:hypothetical protein
MIMQEPIEGVLTVRYNALQSNGTEGKLSMILYFSDMPKEFVLRSIGDLTYIVEG